MDDDEEMPMGDEEVIPEPPKPEPVKKAPSKPVERKERVGATTVETKASNPLADCF